MQAKVNDPLWTKVGKFLRFGLTGLIELPIGWFSKVGDHPFHDPDSFLWRASIESNWEKVREELELVLESRDEIPNFQEISPSQAALTQDSNWKTFMLYAYGYPIEENCQQCPQTAKLLSTIPGMKTAFFSILSPGKHIPPHRGPYKGVLRYHLGLIVPEPKEQCRIRVDKEYQHWEEGKGMFFDDSYDHEVWNDTEGRRVVLFVDFVRPVYFPVSLYNRFIIQLIAWSPFVQSGRKRQAEWNKKRKKDKGGDDIGVAPA
jgi:ornithine lipid ester-linked acyl 2-hydroxylase